MVALSSSVRGFFSLFFRFVFEVEFRSIEGANNYLATGDILVSCRLLLRDVLS